MIDKAPKGTALAAMYEKDDIEKQNKNLTKALGALLEVVVLEQQIKDFDFALWEQVAAAQGRSKEEPFRTWENLKRELAIKKPLAVVAATYAQLEQMFKMVQAEPMWKPALGCLCAMCLKGHMEKADTGIRVLKCTSCGWCITQKEYIKPNKDG